MAYLSITKVCHETEIQELGVSESGSSGEYAKMFEEEYKRQINDRLAALEGIGIDPALKKYWEQIKELWKRINRKTAYTVEFSSE